MKKQNKGPYQTGTIVPLNIISKKYIKIGQESSKKTEHYILTGRITSVNTILHINKDHIEYENGYRYNNQCEMRIETIKPLNEHD